MHLSLPFETEEAIEEIITIASTPAITPPPIFSIFGGILLILSKIKLMLNFETLSAGSTVSPHLGQNADRSGIFAPHFLQNILNFPPKLPIF